ncbi:Protein FAR1-RELATED SEQUENCE 5, partial [Linum perenne]
MAEDDIPAGVHVNDDLQREYARLRDLTEDEVEKLRFESHDEGVEWYIKYGKAWGFSVRKDDVKKDKNYVITEQDMVCNAQGERRSSALKRQKTPRRISRFGCKASSEKDTLRHYREIGLRPSKAYDLEVHHSGGHANVGYTKRDAFNHCHRDDIEKLSEGDAATTLAYLKSKTNGDMDFFMEYTVDEDRMLEKVFWADSSSIADFEAFGDVLMFDTTYKKNKYNLPFVIFS